MRPYFLVVLLFLVGCSTTPTSSSTSSYQQATAYRPPPAAPAPSGAPVPAYPGVYVPNGGTPGVGAPVVGQPSQQGAQVQRSPNKRVLPPTKEPGLWAADGAPRASTRQEFKILDVPIPVENVMRDDALSVTAICADSMNSALKESKQIKRAMALPVDVRFCLAARLYLFCSNRFWWAFETESAQGNRMVPDEIAKYNEMRRIGLKYMEDACAGVQMGETFFDIFTKTTEQWKKGPWE